MLNIAKSTLGRRPLDYYCFIYMYHKPIVLYIGAKTVNLLLSIFCSASVSGWRDNQLLYIASNVIAIF
mgnify:CR=1 FL=1